MEIANWSLDPTTFFMNTLLLNILYYNIHCIWAMSIKVWFVTSFSSHCWIVTAETIWPRTQSRRCLLSCLLHYMFSNPWSRAEICFSERIWRKKKIRKSEMEPSRKYSAGFQPACPLVSNNWYYHHILNLCYISGTLLISILHVITSCRVWYCYFHFTD